MRAPLKNQVKILSFQLLTAGFRKKQHAQDHDQVRARSKDRDCRPKRSMTADVANQRRKQSAHSAPEIVGEACARGAQRRRKKLAEIRTHRAERSGGKEA